MTTELERHLLEQLELERDYFWHRLRWDAVRAELPSTPFQLVDVGAGAGLLGAYLSESMPRASYRFVEPLESLRKNLVDRFGAAADLGEAPNYAGCAVATLLDVLEHQQDDVRFLVELRAKLELGAKLIITVPALPILWSKWDESLGHFRRYTRSTLARALGAAGFEQFTLNYLFIEMVPMLAARRLRMRLKRDASAALALPRLPGVINRAAYFTGRASLRLRKLQPLGTSLIAVAQKR